MIRPSLSTLPLNTMFAVSTLKRNTHLDDDYIAFALDLHTAVWHADIDEDLHGKQPDESNLKSDEMKSLHKAMYGYRKAPALWHQRGVPILESTRCRFEGLCLLLVLGSSGKHVVLGRRRIVRGHLTVKEHVQCSVQAERDAPEKSETGGGSVRKDSSELSDEGTGSERVA